MRKFSKKLIFAAIFSATFFLQAQKAKAENYVGESQTITINPGDTFAYLARDYNLGYLDMVMANQKIDPWLPPEGTEITLPLQNLLPNAPHEGIVINLAEMRLYAFTHEDLPPRSFPLGIGREGLETPTGETIIARKTDGPDWRPTPRMREANPDLPAVIGPGKDNPLGSHALYLGWPQYLIHGTNRPFGIGRRVSSGCMRMYPEDIKTLYALIDPGTKVTVVDQPIKAGWINEKFYIESHLTGAQALEMEAKNSFTPVPLSEEEKTYLTTKAGDKSDSLDWELVNKIIAQRSGMPEEISFTKPAEENQGPPDRQTNKETMKKAPAKLKSEALVLND